MTSPLMASARWKLRIVERDVMDHALDHAVSSLITQIGITVAGPAARSKQQGRKPQKGKQQKGTPPPKGRQQAKGSQQPPPTPPRLSDLQVGPTGWAKSRAWAQQFD